MRLSPFRPQASRQEKFYTIGTLSWMVLLFFGHFYFMRLNFGPEPGILPVFAGVALPCAFLCWLPLYRDRHPSNKVPSYSLLKRIGIYSALFLASLAFVWATFVHLVGPFVTSSFGTPASGEFVITEKSSGYPKRRSCDHFVWLRDRNAEWTGKICLSEQFWATVRVRQVLDGSGNRTVLGRTIEHLSPRAD